MTVNYYAVLGVREDATPEEIRQAYRRLAKQHHPDLNPGDLFATARMKQVNEARDCLLDAEARARHNHDLWLQRQAAFKTNPTVSATAGAKADPGASNRREDPAVKLVATGVRATWEGIRRGDGWETLLGAGAVWLGLWLKKQENGWGRY